MDPRNRSWAILAGLVGLILSTPFGEVYPGLSDLCQEPCKQAGPADRVNRHPVHRPHVVREGLEPSPLFGSRS